MNDFAWKFSQTRRQHLPLIRNTMVKMIFESYDKVLKGKAVKEINGWRKIPGMGGDDYIVYGDGFTAVFAFRGTIIDKSFFNLSLQDLREDLNILLHRAMESDLNRKLYNEVKKDINNLRGLGYHTFFFIGHSKGAMSAFSVWYHFRNHLNFHYVGFNAPLPRWVWDRLSNKNNLVYRTENDPVSLLLKGARNVKTFPGVNDLMLTHGLKIFL